MAFVRSLERHGDNGQAFQKIAAELGWGEGETIEYAKRYLMALIEYEEEQEQPISEPVPDDNDDGDCITSNSPMSIDEEILFETLLVLHLPEQPGSSRNYHDMSWATAVAAHLPLRSTQEVKSRYMKKYASCHVKI